MVQELIDVLPDFKRVPLRSASMPFQCVRIAARDADLTCAKDFHVGPDA